VKISKFFEYAYLGVTFFFLYEAYTQWGVEDGKGKLYLFFAGIAIFMFFFKRNFRKRYQSKK